jgi:hypothetical protein
MSSADGNGDDNIDYQVGKLGFRWCSEVVRISSSVKRQEFVKFAYDNLIALGREKYLSALAKAAGNKSKVIKTFAAAPTLAFRVTRQHHGNTTMEESHESHT